MGNKWIAAGSISMVIAVALGAMGAHGLKGQISDTLLESYKTGVLYHIIHSLALVAVGSISAQKAKNFAVAGYLFLAGIFLFSGSIYILSTREMSGLDWKFLGPITPIGGLLFMAAWITLAISVLRNKA